MKNYRYSLREDTRRISGRYHDDTATFAASSQGHTPVSPYHGTYGGLLFDPRWKSKRAEILSRDVERCIICKASAELQVHHRQYQYIEQAGAFRMPWDYPGHLMITLCKSCHNRGHAKFKVPTLIIR